jgi:hypothetical protein
MTRYSDGGSEPFRIENTKCIRETDKAILVENDSLPNSELWIPKSCVHDDSEVYKRGDEGTLVVFEWFARKNDLV